MRTALARLQRTLHSQTANVHKYRCSRCLERVILCHVRHVGSPLRSYHSKPNRFPDSNPQNEPIPFLEPSFQSSNSKSEDGQNSLDKKDLKVAPERRKDPDAWVELLEQFVPNKLQSLRQHGDGSEIRSIKTDSTFACGQMLRILDSARKQQHAGVELLAHMVVHKQKQTALNIIKLLLDNITDSFPSRSHGTLPSNIQWPGHSLYDMCTNPIETTALVSHSSGSALHWDQKSDDPRYTFILSGTKETTMTELWSTLGSLVVASADLPPEDAYEVNNAILLILGQIHNLDLVPENVYTYRRSTLPTSVQKPPILHLVSSRILTALSDATWRQQQDLMIEKAASHGVTYEEIGKNPPGGRFRLKVRPLSPEIWLEFILWCCVEGGFTSAGARIIRRLNTQTENPWFAKMWSPVVTRGLPGPTIDWQRVRARYGGSVGMREGYSGDRPFVEMPSRTISTEVVLSLVDASINTVNNSVAGGGAADVVQRTITDMISFLEPHDLPSNYFNCLAVRLAQTEVFDLPSNSHALHMWYKRLARMKSLETVQNNPRPTASFDFESLSAHSEAQAGILHQALDGFVQLGDVHRALGAFNELQELVDSSKLQAIASFLSDKTLRPSPGYFFGRPQRAEIDDFVGSHGQLPVYKLTGLLDLTTDTGLTGFGHWLLYNNDPDGPLIHEAAYENSGLSRPLIRLASLDGDDELVSKVLRAQRRARRRPTVALLRALINTNIVTLNFEDAVAQLDELTLARGGGFALSNFAHLAAAILRIEAGNVFKMSSANSGEVLEQAFSLLNQMLTGSLNERSGLFKVEARKSFRHQIGAMLHVFLNCPDSRLSQIAAEYANRYPAPSRPCLAPTTFNIFLEAAIECKGAEEGVRLWDQLCQLSDVGDASSENYFFADDSFISKDHHAEDLDPWGEMESLTERDFSHRQADDLEQPQESRDSILDDTTVDHLRSDFSSGFFPKISSPKMEDSSIEYYPVVVPNQRTLRLIVRKAVRERREGLDMHGNAAMPKQILDWAALELKRFGATTKMISIELEEPIKQSKMRQFDQNLIQAQPRRRRFRKPVGVVRSVGSMFRGNEQSRPSAR